MIKIIAIGKVKDNNLKALIDDYVSKINHYHKLEVIEVKDEPIKDNEKAVLDIEAKRALEKIVNIGKQMNCNITLYYIMYMYVLYVKLPIVSIFKS